MPTQRNFIKHALYFASLLLTLFLPIHAYANDSRVIAIQQAEIQALKNQMAVIQNKLRGKVFTLETTTCEGTHYNCSVRSCIDLCQQKGGRVAHRHELANVALNGQNQCAFVITFDSVNNRFDRGYPMYNNDNGAACHTTNNIPSLSSVPIDPATYNTKVSANCACMIPVL